MQYEAYRRDDSPRAACLRVDIRRRGSGAACRLSVFDARGSLVTTLVNEEKSAGVYTVSWNGRDDAGGAVSSGVHFARITHVSGTKSYKMMLLK
jgi:flagellar hook assembly protein FlgD